MPIFQGEICRMLSISKSLTELERAHHVRSLALETYRRAVLAAAQYVVELDASITEPQRRRLEGLAGQITDAMPEEALAGTAAELRDAFRCYHDEASAFLGHLREELASKAASLQRIFEAMADGDGDHEQRLGRTVKQLREISTGSAGLSVRDAIARAADALEQSLEQLKQHHQMIVAQFLVEIQMLHERIQSLELSALDRTTRLVTRQDFEERIGGILAAGSPHFLLLLRVRNLGAVKRQFGDEVEDSLLALFAKRLRGCVSTDALAARWEHERFVVLLPGGKRESIAAARRVAEHVSGTYVSNAGGKLVRPALQVDAGTAEIAAGEGPERAIGRIVAFFRGVG